MSHERITTLNKNDHMNENLLEYKRSEMIKLRKQIKDVTWRKKMNAIQTEITFASNNEEAQFINLIDSESVLKAINRF